MNSDQRDHCRLLRDAFEQYLVVFHEDDLEPSDPLLDYDFSLLQSRKWRRLAEDLVVGDLRELTNILNGWTHNLRRWHAWNKIIHDRDENEALELRSEFLNPIAHACLLMPASIRDVITSVATNGFHQFRLELDKDYPDTLEFDPKNSQELKKQKHPKRSEKENRLQRLTEVWPDCSGFMSIIREINSQRYRQATSHYRNLNVHSIGPRLGIGQTRIVKRNVEQARRLVETADGKFDFVDVPGKVCVSYSYGGIDPLDLEIVRVENAKEQAIARRCYVECRRNFELLAMNIGGM